MALESKHRIISAHAFAVVGNLQQAPATGFDINDDAGCAGIDRILNELFGDRGGTLHDLTGGN